MAAVQHSIDPSRLTIFSGIGSLFLGAHVRARDLAFGSSTVSNTVKIVESFSADGHNLDSRVYSRSIDGCGLSQLS